MKSIWEGWGIGGRKKVWGGRRKYIYSVLYKDKDLIFFFFWLTFNLIYSGICLILVMFYYYLSIKKFYF